MLITEQEVIKPLLGVDGLREFDSTIRHIEKTTTLTDQSERDEIFAHFEKLFKKNQTIGDTEVILKLKPNHLPIKLKARPVPYHLQRYVKKEINNFIQSGHLEKVKKIDDDSFVSKVVITVKKDKSVKIALDSRKLNERCIKMKPYLTNKEEFQMNFLPR